MLVCVFRLRENEITYRGDPKRKQASTSLVIIYIQPQPVEQSPYPMNDYLRDLVNIPRIRIPRENSRNRLMFLLLRKDSPIVVVSSSTSITLAKSVRDFGYKFTLPSKLHWQRDPRTRDTRLQSTGCKIPARGMLAVGDMEIMCSNTPTRGICRASSAPVAPRNSTA